MVLESSRTTWRNMAGISSTSYRAPCMVLCSSNSWSTPRVPYVTCRIFPSTYILVSQPFSAHRLESVSSEHSRLRCASQMEQQHGPRLCKQHHRGAWVPAPQYSQRQPRATTLARPTRAGSRLSKSTALKRHGARPRKRAFDSSFRLRN